MQKTLRITDTLPGIKKILGFNNAQLADFLGISLRSLNNYLNSNSSSKEISNNVFNKIISLIEAKNLNLFDLFLLDGDEYLFHASRTIIEGKITTLKNANRLKDFDNGFYLSETFKVASTYVDHEENPHIYRFLKKDVIKGKNYHFSDTLNDSINWVLFIALSRGKIKNEKDKTFLKEYFYNMFNDKDVLIGKIADSFNFDVMNEFLEGLYDLKQVEKALKLVDIGNQYVVKNESNANKLKYNDEFIIDKKLKNYINKWHAKQNEIIKEKNKAFLTRDSFDLSLTFTNVLEKMRKENE